MSLLSEESTLYYREITLADKGYMQCLCLECFPIEYPDTWFNYLLQGDDWTYTLGAFEMATDRMVGMIVGQVQTLDHIEKDYGYVLEEAQAGEIIMYITIFGEFVVIRITYTFISIRPKTHVYLHVYTLKFRINFQIVT